MCATFRWCVPVLGLSRNGTYFALSDRLHGTSDTELRRCCDSTGRHTNPVAAMIRSTEEKTMKKATAISYVFLVLRLSRSRLELLRAPTGWRVSNR